MSEVNQALFEQSLLQENVSGVPETFLEPIESIELLAEQHEVYNNLSVVKEHLVSLSKNNVNLSRETALMTNVAIESMLSNVPVSKETLAISIESLQQDSVNVQLAIEGIKEKLSDLFYHVRLQLIRVSKDLAMFTSRFNQRLKNTSNYVKRIRQAYLDRKRDVPKYGYIKPENWMTNLCYLNTGFDTGLKAVTSDLVSFIKEHTKVFSSANKKYLKGLIDFNQNKDLDKIKYNPDDFILSSMRYDTKEVRRIVLKQNNTIYKGYELPGGKCFYAQLQSRKTEGKDAIESISKLDYYILPFELGQYSAMKEKVIVMSGLGFSAWLALIHPMLFAAGAASTMYYRHKVNQAHPDSSITLDKAFLFETLNIKDLNNAITRSEEIVKLLDQWQGSVVDQFWKHNDLAKIASGAYSDGNNNDLKQLRNYIQALMNLGIKETQNFASYCFDVLNSILKYADKSLKQYSS